MSLLVTYDINRFSHDVAHITNRKAFGSWSYIIVKMFTE